MQDMYGDRVRPDDVLTHPLSHRSFVERGVHLAAGLVSSARHLVVNSTVARDMIRADVGPGRALPPCTVLPHAVPDAPAVDARSHGSGRLLVALGVVHAVKRPQVLVEALARLGPDVRLAFVGPCDDEVRDEIHRTAEAAGVSGRIEVTGRVDSGDYWQWLARADVAVQLREPTFGESSGAIHDAIAAGVPVVTSVASARDLPSGALRFVGADVSAVALATVLRDLLADSEARQAMVAAGRAYATEWSFDRVTDRLAEVVRDVVLSTLRR
jgi:glycosyltransferase involved in cell wall biosynthesis